ncbi:MAG: YbaY family lipoprotein [Rhodanobacter sp.]
MRKTVLSLVSIATLALVGCNAPSPSQSADGTPAAANSAAPATAGSTASEVSGSITLSKPAKLSENAALSIKLVDVSADSSTGLTPLATKTVMPATTFPVSFALPFNPAQIKASNLYVVQAELVDGDRHYVMKIQSPVLGKNGSNVVSIQLVAQETDAEKMLAAFSAEKEQLGGMKVSNGTKLEKDASRGWQVFRKDGQVKFIRELVDYGDKGFTSTDYSYFDGKPVVVVQQTKSSREAKPSAIDRAGWDEKGSLVLKQHQAGAAVTELGADAAASLQKQAVTTLSQATGGKNK